MTPEQVPAGLVEKAARVLHSDECPDSGCEGGDLRGYERAARNILAAVLPEAIAMGHDEAADVVHAEARWQTELAMRRSLGAEYTAQRMSVVEETIRGFAARHREGGQ